MLFLRKSYRALDFAQNRFSCEKPDVRAFGSEKFWLCNYNGDVMERLSIHSSLRIVAAWKLCWMDYQDESPRSHRSSGERTAMALDVGNWCY